MWNTSKWELAPCFRFLCCKVSSIRLNFRAFWSRGATILQFLLAVSLGNLSLLALCHIKALKNVKSIRLHIDKFSNPNWTVGQSDAVMYIHGNPLSVTTKVYVGNDKLQSYKTKLHKVTEKYIIENDVMGQYAKVIFFMALFCMELFCMAIFLWNRVAQIQWKF